MARSCSGAALALVGVIVLAVMVEGSVGTNFVVGGPLQWQLSRYGDPNFYQDWAQSNFPYRTTDTLEFVWNTGESVLQVTEADYNTCNVGHPIAVWSTEGHVVFLLTGLQNQKVFFISGADGHCAAGQKFFIDVYPPA